MIAFLALVLLAGPSGQRRPIQEARTLWQWTAAEGMAAWSHNAEVRDIETEPGAVRFRTAGSDPIMVLRSRTDVPATAWQAFEVRMQADRDGVIELFWTETTEGPYGGFSQEKLTHIGVKGDGQWRTYRVYPFWQKVGRIVSLRFDPYDSARFAIESMRIIEIPAPAPPSGASLAMPGLAEVYRPLQRLSARATGGALRLSLESHDGFGLAPIRPADADATPCVSVRLASSSVRRASVVFASDASVGLHDAPFEVIADGRQRTYNLDMLSHPQWKGRIVAIGLRPGARAGDGCALTRIAVAAAPSGPAELRIASFDAEEALPRVGRPIALVARAANAGGNAAVGVRATLTLPAGVRLSSAASGRRSPVGPIRFGQEETFRWTIVAQKPGTLAVGLRMARAGGAAAERTLRISVTRAPRVTARGYPPAPSAVRGKLDVGVYYFPGWRTPGQWAPITRFPERRPVLGWYREGDPSVADWHIKWAAEHGVTFFAYDWYWSQGARSLEHALHDGYFASRYRDRLKFCLLWANHNADGTSSHDDMMQVVRFWIERYFRRPEHYTIEGKPVVIIFSPYRFRADMSSAGVRRSFDAMRAECVGAGLGGLYLIACAGYDVPETKLLAEEGYDAVTAYNWPGLGLKGSERWAPYADLLSPHRALWERYAAEGSLPIMTPVSGGWDSRPWHGDTALVRSQRTPALFKSHLEDARRFIETHHGKALPVALVEAWNEFGEGSYIEPQREFGFDYLDAIRDVFTNVPRSHTDLTPPDVGHAVPRVDVEASLAGVWDLAKNADGWDAGMDLTAFERRPDGLRAVTSGRDPAYFGPPMQIAASDRGVLRLRMRMQPKDGAPQTDTAQVFWTTRASATSEAASVRFPVALDGKWHDYRVALSANSRWRGIIVGLRVDPCNQPGVVIDLARVEMAR
jgi:hypothetical protein